MFSNKKTNLPPRPNIPDPEHILEDLNNAPMDDIAFQIINKGFCTMNIFLKKLNKCRYRNFIS